jgi:hypothetical protein
MFASAILPPVNDSDHKPFVYAMRPCLTTPVSVWPLNAFQTSPFLKGGKWSCATTQMFHTGSSLVFWLMTVCLCLFPPLPQELPSCPAAAADGNTMPGSDPFDPFASTEGQVCCVTCVIAVILQQALIVSLLFIL